MSDQNEMREQFYGYYISLYATGVPEVDAVLEAVAGAAHGYHHTEDWNDGQERGTSAVQSIQAAAQAAADAFRATPAPQAAPSDADIQRIGKSLPAFQNMGYRLLTGQQMTKPEREDYEAHIKFARYVLAAAPAVAITQAATSEPVAMPQVELDASLDTWMDVELKDVPTWQRKGFNVRTLYAAPVAHLAGTTPNTEAPSDERAAFEAWAISEGDEAAAPRFVGSRQIGYAFSNKAWAAWQGRAALSAQQAGVQEAPSEDAKDAARELVRNAVWKALPGTYYCDRVWSAWQVGTMTQDDFTPAEDVDEVLDEITDSVIAALAAATQTEKKP